MTRHDSLSGRYRYDPLDRLASTTAAGQASVQRFYLKTRLATEIQGAACYQSLQVDEGLLAQRQTGPGTATCLLATDSQRSVLQAMAETVTEYQAYSAYGYHPVQSGLQALPGFNGERPDPLTGHYLLGNGYRLFNPVLMRFNSPDSLSPFGVGGINAYAYCQGDPVNFQDPTGHFLGFLPAVRSVVAFMREAFRTIPDVFTTELPARSDSDWPRTVPIISSVRGVPRSTSDSVARPASSPHYVQVANAPPVNINMNRDQVLRLMQNTDHQIQLSQEQRDNMRHR